MATSSQAPPAATAAIIGSGGATTTTSQTIIGSHLFKIDHFSRTRDLGVGKCINSGTFSVGGHAWYIECYPCGVDEDEESAGAGWIYLKLGRQEDEEHQNPGYNVSAKCKFTLMEMESVEDGSHFKKLIGQPSKFVTLAAEDDDRSQSLSLPGTDFIKREELESLLKDDCFNVRCILFVDKFPAVPLPPPDLATETVAHVLTVDGYSKTREVVAVGEVIESNSFRVGRHRWSIQFYPSGEEENDAAGVPASLCLEDPGANDEVKVRFEMTLLTGAGQIISSAQNFHTFTERCNVHGFYFLGMMEHESCPLLQDSIHIRCEVAVVEGITAMMPNLRRGIRCDLRGSQQVRGDVTFEVGGNLFEAHKCVLATRCTALVAELFGPSGTTTDNAGVTDQPVRIVNMEPRVFQALLYYIYTDALPEVHEEEEEDKVVMAQGLLVAADRYALERLKLICGDMLCSYINDAHTAIDTLELAVKYGCHRLREACTKFLTDYFAKLAP